MLVGALSDTHDNLEQVEKAKDVFSREKVGALIHCGDFITCAVYDILADLHLPTYGVFGNNDYEEDLCARAGEQIRKEPYTFTLGGRRFMICHQQKFVDKFKMNKEPPEIIVYGSTHEPEICKRDNILIVNPGEACGWVHGKSTAAVINLEELSAEIIELEI